jgi:gas vesicle protein
MRRHEEEEVVVIESDSGAGVKWFLLGAMVGAGLGLLFAPDSGQRTRRKLGKEAARLRREAEDRWDDLREDVVDKGRQIKSSVEGWTEGVKEGVQEGRRVVERKATSARDDLERRLADARARRRAAVGADGVADDADDDGDNA